MAPDANAAHLPAKATDATCERAAGWRPPQAVLAWCPMCDGPLDPEHAHYRCRACGWRDSCCD